MIQCQVKIQGQPGRLVTRLKARWKAALPVISARVLADCNRYARDDTGTLIRSSYASSRLSEGKLIWDAPYARRVYYTGTPSRSHNPQASLRWCERAKAAHVDAWTALADTALKGEPT